MRARAATLVVATILLLTAAGGARAESADVHVRIEGANATLLDRVVRVSGHDVRAASDAQAHHCDGTNAHRNATPGPTATSAAVDALASLGDDFDAQWYPGLDDYYVTRLGPEREDADKLWSWGLLVNRAFAPYGGCQLQVHDGDEVLWALDAFSQRPFLWLAGPATAQLGAPLTVAVSATQPSPEQPQAPGSPYGGAAVEAVDANGRPAPAGVADAGVSGADGTAAVVFHAAGWQRLKARATGVSSSGDAAAVASNSVDVCVEATPGAGCGGPPPVLSPPPSAPASPSRAAPRPRAPRVPAWTRRFARGSLRDDRDGALRWRGGWVRTRARRAWRGTLTRGARGDRLALALAAGVPVVALRTGGAGARVSLSAGGRTRTYALPVERAPRTHLLAGPRLRRRGALVVRVLAGGVLIDAVGRAASGARAAGARADAVGGARASAAATTATTATAGDHARLDRTIRFLQDAQNADGGFGGSDGAPSDPLFSTWAALALAAGGVNPRDQRRPGGRDVYAYLVAHAGALVKTTDFERAALVAFAAGADPRDYGGRDLVRAILARRLPTGAFAFEVGGTTGYVNATAFALLALAPLREPALADVLRGGADWLLRVQDASGAWGYAPGAELSSDTTAMAIEALHAAGRGGTPQERRAWSYVRALQNADGGFGFNASVRASNSASTAWVAQAMWAAGADPARAAAPGGASALDYLAAMQRPDGAIRWTAQQDLNPVWMTAYAAPAYAGRPLPLAPVPRAARAVARAQHTTAVVRAPQPAATGPDGQGGFSAGRGVVRAGGGGRGAPLFSRPQGQSRGAKRGGVRRTAAGGAHGARGVRTDAGSGGTLGATGAQAGDGGAAALQAGGRGADSSAGPVTGVVVADPRAAAATRAAPGLLGAQAGDGRHGPGLALALAGLLALCAGLGAALERRRPEALR